MSKIGFHRHSLSLKLGVTITAFIALLFVSSVGLLYIRSRQLVKQEALERAEKALKVYLAVPGSSVASCGNFCCSM